MRAESDDTDIAHGSILAALLVRVESTDPATREPLSASDGHEALELLDDRFDQVGLVLMDLSMPRMSGEETFRRMREAGSDVRVVFTSGYDESEVQDLRDGVVGFLKKPFELEALLSLVRRGLSGDA